MSSRLSSIAFAILLAAAASPALACRSYVGPTDYEYGSRAETIVVGRITDYEQVHNQRQAGAIIPLSIYSRIFVTVERVLAGEAGRTVSAILDIWPAGNLGTVPKGPVVVALYDLSAAELANPPSPRRNLMAVVQKPCESTFVFDAGSEEAMAFLASWRRAHPDAPDIKP